MSSRRESKTWLHSHFEGGTKALFCYVNFLIDNSLEEGSKAMPNLSFGGIASLCLTCRYVPGKRMQDVVHGITKCYIARVISNIFSKAECETCENDVVPSLLVVMLCCSNKQAA